MRQGRLVCVVGVAALLGCYSSEDPETETGVCVDGDGDGYGNGPDCVASDCDDGDASRTVQCAVSCDGDPPVPGCVCASESAPLVCYDGPAGTAAVGSCSTGLIQCRAGTWSRCEGQVLPSNEVCNGEDDDCDGVADDGVASACGDCDPSCLLLCLGVGCEPFVPGEGAAVAPDGALIVAAGPDLAPRQLWVTSVSSGTVIRVDTEGFEATGRFRTGPEGASYPVAVATNDLGAAFVVDPRGGQSATTLTQVLSGDCPDVDGDGIVETSTSTEALEWGEDECVGWQIDLEDCNGGWGCGNGAGIALTDEGRRAWVSLSQARSLVEVDLEAGELTGSVADVSGTPMGIVADSEGNLWASTYGDSLYRVPLDDPEDPEVISPPGSFWTTSVDVDDLGRVAVVSPLAIYDPRLGEFDTADWQAYDVAVGLDGSVWATDGARTLRRYDPESLDYDSFPVDHVPTQIAVDLDGNVWVVDSGRGTIIAYDDSGSEIATLLDDCEGGQWGGSGCAGQGALEGDPTGLRLRRAFGRRDRAEARHVFESHCADQMSIWEELSWQVEGGDAAFSVRGAESREALPAVAWVDLGGAPPEAGTVALRDTFGVGDHFLEVRAVLEGEDARLVRLAVTVSCLPDI